MATLLKVESRKQLSTPAGKSGSQFKWKSVFRNFPAKYKVVQIRHLIPIWVHFLCTYTWKPFVLQIRNLRCSGVLETLARQSIKNSCVCWGDKFRAAGENSCELIVIFWIRSFMFGFKKLVQSQESTGYRRWRPLKTMQVYFRLKMVKSDIGKEVSVKGINWWDVDTTIPSVGSLLTFPVSVLNSL